MHSRVMLPSWGAITRKKPNWINGFNGCETDTERLSISSGSKANLYDLHQYFNHGCYSMKSPASQHTLSATFTVPSPRFTNPPCPPS
ncbi:hypothetical protein EIO60_01476|nr:hypothetical protein [Candidatus Pantoea persica]